MNGHPRLMTHLPTPPRRQLAYDGRQFTSLAEGPTVPMHLHRYLFAATLAAGRTVLDLGCGEGYGAAILAETSRRVIGLDHDDRNLDHARRAYRRDNLDFVRGDAFDAPEALPPVDVVVAFETMETLEAAQALLAGLAARQPRPATIVLSLPTDVEPRVTDLGDHAWAIAAVFRQRFEVGSVMRRIAWDGDGNGDGKGEVRTARCGAGDLGSAPDTHFAGAPDRTVVVLHDGVGTLALTGRYDFNDGSVIERLEQRIERAEQALAAAAVPSGFADRTERPQPVLFHYHIYKNAGSSVDRLLSQRFGAGWQSFETMSDDRQQMVADLCRWLSAKPHLEAVSSHTCPMLGADFGTHLLLPMVFLRDPLERVFSGYRFERREARDEFRHRLAKSEDFEGYFKGMLEGPQSTYVRNFQAVRFASLLGPLDPRPLRARALAAFDALPFVGLVPRFLDSIETYARLYAAAGVDMPVAEAFDNQAADFPDGLEDARRLYRTSQVCRHKGPRGHRTFVHRQQDPL